MIEQAFENLKEEAENFFVTKFITGPALEKAYKFSLDVVFDITKSVDAGKGLMAFNPEYGQGKSFFFEVVQHRHRRRKGRNRFVVTSSRALCKIFTDTPKDQDPIHELEKFISCRDLFIDDIGDELKDGLTRKRYGNELNVLRHVLLFRYDLWIKEGFRTFGTTNLTLDQVSAIYGGRVADRWMQMFHHITYDFVEGSFRQIRETRRLTPAEIQKSWEKFRTPAKVEKLDLIKFYNEVIQESNGYFEAKVSDTSFWDMTANFLIDQDLLVEKDFAVIDEAMLDAAENLVRQETKDTQRIQMQNAPNYVMKAVIDRALGEITKEQIYDRAKLGCARRKFMSLRARNHVFA